MIDTDQIVNLNNAYRNNTFINNDISMKIN